MFYTLHSSAHSRIASPSVTTQVVTASSPENKSTDDVYVHRTIAIIMFSSPPVFTLPVKDQSRDGVEQDGEDEVEDCTCRGCGKKKPAEEMAQPLEFFDVPLDVDVTLDVGGAVIDRHLPWSGSAPPFSAQHHVPARDASHGAATEVLVRVYHCARKKQCRLQAQQRLCEYLEARRYPASGGG